MMCRKKTITDQPAFTPRTISGCMVGNYPGTANDLAGPTEDWKDLTKAVAALWPDMTFRGFLDHNATAKRLLSEFTEGSKMVGEDGMLFVIMDNCHSESNTRNGKFKARARGVLRGIGYNKVLVFSAALANQYASDAEFNGGYNGAWHYCLIKTLRRGITYLQWFTEASELIKRLGFTQTPVIEGPLELQNRLVFEGNVITIDVSSHGGQVPDNDGDEADGRDEVIYMHDRAVRDDEIREILEKMDMRIFANNKQLISRSMKIKSFKQTKDWKDDLPNTLISFSFLVFTVLAGFGVIDSNQAAQAGPIVSTTFGALSTAVAGVIALIGILKKKPPVA
jgi:hypothetical protein